MIEAIVLAGGLGTRIRSVVKDRPKPMALIHGRPFLEYVLNYWQKQGVRRFILSVGYRKEMIQAYFGKRYRKAEIEYSIERRPLGTGGGVLQAIEYLKTRRGFLVLNGDTFFEVSLRALKKHHADNQADFTLAMAGSASEDRYERMELDRTSRVLDLKARGEGKKRAWINGGVYWAEPACLREWLERPRDKISLESKMIPELIKTNHKVFGFKSRGRFLDIGTPASYKSAENFLKEIR